MADLPNYIVAILTNFAPLFSLPVFNHIKTIFLGHVLTNKGRRTVADILRTVGLTFTKSFSKYHRVFYGAKWSALNASQILLQLLLQCCFDQEIRFVIDSTIERRKGPHIKCLGRKRDPVASTKNNKVLCIGQEWLVTSLLIKFPWTWVYWACPFLSILMPPKMPLRSSKNESDLHRNTRHKKSTHWAKQIVFQLRKWLGEKLKCSLIADSAFACYELAHACSKMNIALITRMRIDSRLFEYPTIQKGRGRKRLVGKRVRLTEVLREKSTKWTQAPIDWYGYKTKTIEYVTGQNLWYACGIPPIAIRWVLIRDPEDQLDPIVLMSTDLFHDPIWIIESFIYRWRIETTFEEMRRHLGYETQRHWSDLAVDRVTPCILASFSILCLCGEKLCKNEKLSPQKAGWYKKQMITFSDVLCSVRKSIFEEKLFLGSVKIPNLRKKDIKEIIYWVCAA